MIKINEKNLSIFYKLNENKIPTPCTLEEWSQMINDIESRRVRSDYINDIHISTVFLGTNSFYEETFMFETMVFGSVIYDQYYKRYSTWDEAVIGHDVVLKLINDELRLSK